MASNNLHGYKFWHEKKYRMSLIMTEIRDGEITILSNIPIDLDTHTANVKHIKNQLKKDLNMTSPVLLNSRFQEIFDSNSTRGDTYWHRGSKFYFIEKSLWTDFNDKKAENSKNINQNKKINRPFSYDYKERPSSKYYTPVTGPRTFKKVIKWIKIEQGAILLYKDVPFDLTEPTANIPTIKGIIQTNLEIPDVIILDSKFKEVKDSSKNRGEAFWNNSNNFYFLDRFEWQRYDYSLPDCEFDRVKFRNIKHKTYFDRNRNTYYKNV